MAWLALVSNDKTILVMKGWDLIVIDKTLRAFFDYISCQLISNQWEIKGELEAL